MQLHNLRPLHKPRRGQRIGRGGKRGTTAGRGTKGQKARAGAKFRPAEREILKRIPKLRGYKFKSFKVRPQVVNLSAIAKVFSAGEEVSPKSLLERGLIRKMKGELPKVKILGSGEIQKKLTFKNVQFSRPAAAKINS